MNKGLSIAYIATFFLIITASAIAIIALPKRDFSEFENRVLESSIDFSLDSIKEGEFSKNVDNFLNDQFPFRDEAVTLKNCISYLMGAREFNGIYIADKNYLIESYKDSDFANKRIKGNAKKVARFVNLVGENLGYDHVKCVTIPSKITIYDDYLPANAVTSTRQTYMKKTLISKLDKPDETYIDLTDALKEHKDEYIYYRTDHHWTSLGAAYAYQAITGGSIDYDSEVVADDFYGTDYNKVHLASKADEITKYNIPAADSTLVDIPTENKTNEPLYHEDALKTHDKYTYFLNGNYQQLLLHTGTKNGKTLILIKDSYSNSLVPFLANDYETILMIDLRYATEGVLSYVEKLGSFDDFMIIYNEEKFMKDSHQDFLE
ncbi:MAG: hypothetical protein K5656_11975 [Lachnospiraceae bacterium]|nr:hypothetical protein [Lachnospiraceae bacterium]